MRLIYITSGFPYPLTSGYLRHYHLLARLARDHEIRLFSLVGNDHEPAHRAAVEQLGIEVATFPTASTAGRRLATRLGRVAPRLVAGGVRELRAAVAATVDSGWADAAVLSGKTTSAALRPLARVPLVVDACDATSMRLESQLGERSGVRRVVGALELRAMRSIERRLDRGADHVLAASERDREHLAPVSPSTVVPNGVETSYWTRTTASRPPDTVVFTGKMSYAPNEDAARRLIEQVWPQVRARRPAASLLVVGTSPRPVLSDAGGRDGIEVTGRVDDMRTHLQRATVFAAPIRYGAGIQNKVLEALAMGLPVVASTNASDGLVLDGDPPPIRVVDDLGAMADSIVDELVAADTDPAPVAANRAWVSARFDWDASAARVDGIVRAVVGNHHGGAA